MELIYSQTFGRHCPSLPRSRRVFQQTAISCSLILTPADERLIGKNAARDLVEGIPDAVEMILPNTGHMFRFTHPVTYANAIREFLQACLGGNTIAA